MHVSVLEDTCIYGKVRNALVSDPSFLDVVMRLKKLQQTRPVCSEISMDRKCGARNL